MLKRPFHMRQDKGFTLIEVLVSVAIFSIVMTIALGALLAMSDSDRRAETYKSLVDNLDFSIDSMSRTIRTGTGYSCGATSVPFTPQDCATAKTSLGFTGSDGRTYIYSFDQNATDCGQTGSAGCIMRSINGGTPQPLTSSEIQVKSLQFLVTGISDAKIQPKVTIFVTAAATSSQSVPATVFNVQTSVTQRIYDQ